MSYLLFVDQIAPQIKGFGSPLIGYGFVVGNDHIVEENVVRHGPQFKTNSALTINKIHIT